MHKILLDTDVCVDLINGKLETPASFLKADIAISSVTFYELSVGVEKAKFVRTKQETRLFLNAVPVLEFNRSAAAESAKVRAELESKGLGIGPYDTLIAGHCRILDRALATYNLREFSRVKGLNLFDL